MVDCTIHLITLQADASTSAFLDHIATAASILFKGRPHGWVHKSRNPGNEGLSNDHWELLLLASPPISTFSDSANRLVSSHFSVQVSVPESQFTQMNTRQKSKPTASMETPPLPSEWSQNTVPSNAIVKSKASALESGELRLDPEMADFLSTAFPAKIAQEPACFFNLFRYRGGDRSVHDAYMQGFKDNFGSAAGASVLFMGPVKQPSRESHQHQTTGREERWDDANLVQYDSVWHYAYVLSTDIYKELNKQKVDGLDDTCILLVSEVELFEKSE